MSETISQIPAGQTGFLSDVVPVTQGSTGPGTGVTRKVTTARLLGSSGLVYAADPAFGVVANGSTDDTSSWTAALTYAAATGAYVVAPIGITNITQITIPSNTGIIGRNVECYSAGSGFGSTTLGTVFAAQSSTLPAIIMAPNSQIQSVQIKGNSSQDCIRLSGSTFGSISIVDVDIFGGSNGVNGNTISSSTLLTGCRIHECANGVTGFIDGNITNNIITNCSTAGINLGTSCARVLISGNRIIANGTNILLSGTSSSIYVTNVAVTGNIIHDSNLNNINLNFCHNVVVSGNEVGCGGRSQGSTPGTAGDANFGMANSTGCIIANNSSWVGNDLTAYIGPYYAIYDGGSNVNCQISNNILPYHNNSSSSTSGPINTTATFNLAATLNVTYWTGTN